MENQGSTGTGQGQPAAGAAAAGQQSTGVNPPAQEAGAGGQVQGQDQGAPDAWAGELPPEVREHFGGARTFGEVRDRYSGSSAEARRLQQERDDLQALAMEMMKRQSAPAVMQTPATAAGQGGGFFGYPSVDAYRQAWEADPQGTEARKFEWLMSQGKLQGMQQAMEERMAPIQGALMRQQWERQVDGVAQKYPESAQESGTKAVSEFVGPYRQELQAVIAQYPRVPWAEIVWKAADYDRLLAFSKGASGRLQGERQAAGVARPAVGAGAGMVAAGSAKTKTEAAQRAIARLRSAGKQISPEMEAAFVRSASGNE